MATDAITFVQKENARLKQENDELREELHGLREFVQIINDLNEAAAQITSDKELMPLLRSIHYKALNLLDAPDGSLMLLDDNSNELVFVIVVGALEMELLNYRIPADQGIAGWIVKNQKSLLVRDVRHDMRFSMMVDEQFKFSTQSIAAAPIISDGKVYGLIEALNQPGDNPFSDHDLALLTLVCRAAGEALASIERRNPG